MVSLPCALDQAIVVYDPLHRWVYCFTIAFNDGRKCVCLRFWEHFIRYSVWEVDRYGGRSVMMSVSIYPTQWWNTTVHHSGLPDLPMLPGRDCVPPHPTCSARHGTRCHTLCRTTKPLLTELRSSQISCCLLSRFGSCQFFDNDWMSS